MFTETWRRRWGLKQAPFAHEDADRDPLLERVDSWAVHSSYERLLGSDGEPASAVIFGERGSGKSALRRSVVRGLNASGKSLTVEITDVDPWLEIFQNRQGNNGVGRRNFSALNRVDLIDLLLSAGLMRLSEVLGKDPQRLKKLGASERAELILLVAAYHADLEGDREERVQSLLAARCGRLWSLVRVGLGLVGATMCLAPLLQLQDWWPLKSSIVPTIAATGAVLLGSLGMHAVWRSVLARHMARRIIRSMSITRPDRALLHRALVALPRSSAPQLLRGAESAEEGRYRLLRRVIQLVRRMGWSGIVLLVDRIDESTLLEARVDSMGSFIDPVLEHKLLQLDGFGLKLFLPVELTPMVRGAGPDRLRRMRLDKAALVDEIRWSGQELLELADRRLAAASNGPSVSVADLLSDDLDLIEMRDALHGLGTPRMAFAFLRDLLEDHARELPDDLPRDSPEWCVGRASFERQRAAWSDRARILRRMLRRTSVDCGAPGS
jgi:hypothetical protein